MERKEVFISYKSEDVDQAQWLKSVLETNGISCWMAPASIPGGSNYAREIPQAIEGCRVFVLLLTHRCQESIWVPKELDTALNCKKLVMPFVLEDCELNDDFNFYLSNVQRYAAYQNKMKAAEQMVRDIWALLNVNQTTVRPAPPVQKERKKPHAAWVAVALGLCALLLVFLTGRSEQVDVFEALQIDFEGAAPYASVKLTNNAADPFVQGISFTATPDKDLDVGDTVTITTNISKEEAKEQGYRLKSYSKTITVEDLPTVVSDPSLLKPEDVAALQEKMKKFISGRGEDYPAILYADGSESDLSADDLANCLTEFTLLEKGYVCTVPDMFASRTTLILPL